MTDEEIDAMQAGREMDVLVARHVFGDIYHPVGACDFTSCYMCENSCKLYSRDIGHAWQVVEKICEQTPKGDIHIEHFDGEWDVSTCYEEVSGKWNGFTAAETAPLAICRAALKCCKEPLQFRKEA